MTYDFGDMDSFNSLVDISLDSLGALVQNIQDLPHCLHMVLDSLDLTNRPEDEEAGRRGQNGDIVRLYFCDLVLSG
jgi:hypothetical protein